MSSLSLRWKDVPGAAKLKRRLSLCKNDNGIFKCPVADCGHEGFRSDRGCRKHVKTSHAWFYYFDEYPKNIFEKEISTEEGIGNADMNPARISSKCIPEDVVFTEKFGKWMCSSTGGSRTKSHANQICSRVIKFIQLSQDDVTLGEIQIPHIDYFLGSMTCLTAFLQHLEEEKSIGYSGSVSYVNALLEAMDYRKFMGVAANVLSNFGVAEVFLKRARKCIARKMRVQWTEQLDIETLEGKGHWASLKELQKVIPFHMGRYEEIIQKCKEDKATVTSSDLTFATRFIATFLFLRVKGSRPMTYQFLTISMLENAAKNGGYVDQKKFKTADKYGFDSMVIDEICMRILESYIKHVRPLYMPKCEYVLLNRNGQQFTKLSQAMSILVYMAIGKHIHPTRYRQIIETESAASLSLEDQDLISQDQKHTSNVARIHYRKKRSRDVAEKGDVCVKKLRGESGKRLDVSLGAFVDASREKEDSDSDSDSTIFITQNKFIGEIEKEQAMSSTVEQANEGELGVTSYNDKRMQQFSAKEDNELIKGIKKYGYGHWGKILSDKKLDFLRKRTRNSLLKRARSKQFINMYQRVCGKPLL